MRPEIRKRIQISLIVLLVLATIRVAYIFHERRAEAPKRQGDGGSRALTADEYVFPKKFYAYDLASAKALIGNSVWVKQGYGNLVYPVAIGGADLSRGTASLSPIEPLKIIDVVRQPPGARGQPELVAIGERGDSSRVAFSIGSFDADGSLKSNLNDLFYIEDPHQLYRHWPADVWKSIDAHQAKPGMNELQVNFALGVPRKAAAGDYGDRTLEYPNGGNPVRVSFSENKAVDVTPVKNGAK